MLSIIVAIGNHNVIGCENKMPWHLPKDLKYFKDKTKGHVVIMGRKTLESIGKPLPNRRNVVITKNKDYICKFSEVKIVNSLEDIKEYIEDEDENFVIGGATIYKELLPYCTKLYITRIYEDFKGDSFFPKIEESKWKITGCENPQEDGPFKYEFLVYEKRS